MEPHVFLTTSQLLAVPMAMATVSSLSWNSSVKVDGFDLQEQGRTGVQCSWWYGGPFKQHWDRACPSSFDPLLLVLPWFVLWTLILFFSILLRVYEARKLVSHETDVKLCLYIYVSFKENPVLFFFPFFLSLLLNSLIYDHPVSVDLNKPILNMI